MILNSSNITKETADFRNENVGWKFKIEFYFQVEIQVLHMSQDAKDMVHKTLTELRGGSYQITDEKLYKDTGQK